MGTLSWIVLGGLAGWIAALLMGEKQGCLLHIATGVVGALVGGFLFSVAGQATVSGINLWSVFVAVIGSVLLLAFLRAVRGPVA